MDRLKNFGPILAIGIIIALVSYSAGVSIQYAQDEPQTTLQKINQFNTPISNDERVADYTEALAWFTAFLAITSAFQGWILIRANQTAKTSADAAKLSAEFLPVVERAYLFVDNIKVEVFNSIDLGEIEKKDAPSQNFDTNHTFCIEIKFHNIGKTPAIIKDIDYNIRYLRFPAFNGLRGKRSPMSIPVKSAGETQTYKLSAKIDNEYYEAAMSENGKIYFFGSIGYDDIFGIDHALFFYSEWNFEEERFIVSTHKDHKLNHWT